MFGQKTSTLTAFRYHPLAYHMVPIWKRPEFSVSILPNLTKSPFLLLQRDQKQYSTNDNTSHDAVSCQHPFIPQLSMRRAEITYSGGDQVVDSLFDVLLADGEVLAVVCGDAEAEETDSTLAIEPIWTQS